MFHKFFLAALVLIAVVNAAFGIDCSNIKCPENAKPVCALAIGEDCHVKFPTCVLERLTCIFKIEYQIVSDDICAAGKSQCL